MSLFIRSNAFLGGGGSGGTYLGGTDLSSGATTTDANAEFNTIVKTSGTTNTVLFDKTLDDIKLGTYAIMIRMKVTDITKTNNIVKFTASSVNGSTETKLSECNVVPNKFPANNVFETVGFITKFNPAKGSKLKIKADLLANAGAGVSIDYVLISPAFVSIASL